MKAIEPKELTVLKGQTTKAYNRAHELVINDRKELENATDILKAVKDASKELKAKKESITKPINEALKEIRSMFAPIEDQLSESEGIVKGKMLEFNRIIEQKAREAAAELEKKVEEGKMTLSVAAKQLEEAPQVEKKVEGKRGSIQYRTVRKVRINDETKIPREFLVPDFTKINRAALAGISIEGVEVYEEQQVASY